MKQKDVALILIIGFVSGVGAFFLSDWVFGGEQSREQTTEVVDAITPEFEQPPKKYFNADSINPTKLIEIGDDGNSNPFNSNSQ